MNSPLISCYISSKLRFISPLLPSSTTEPQVVASRKTKTVVRSIPYIRCYRPRVCPASDLQTHPHHHHDPTKTPTSPSLSCTTSDSSSTSPMPEKAKIRGSPQLNRWSRARAIRSCRKLDRQGRNVAASPGHPVETWEGQAPTSVSSTEGSESSAEDEVGVKGIYIVSDSTGWTAEHSVNAALGQFEPCLVDRFCPVNTHLFSGVEDVNCLLEIVKHAAKEGAMLVYTLADPSMGEAARSACKICGVPSIDVLGPVTEAIASHLCVSPLGLSRSAPGRKPLSEEYFKRIEAVEFTIKQDDGALPQNLKKADIVLAVVSHTGKTPLSIYLAQKGYKVADVPIVMGMDLPSSLFTVSRRKVFGLTINPLVLQTIRKTRARSLRFSDEMMSNYAEMEYVREKLEYASKIFSQNPNWPVIEVTGKAIEETAAVVLRLYHDRKQNCAIPRIPKRY